MDTVKRTEMWLAIITGASSCTSERDCHDRLVAETMQTRGHRCTRCTMRGEEGRGRGEGVLLHDQTIDDD